ncbi:hypothetical protein ASE38_03790 [Cellulomonas sp. Root930]|nr:hypothetical protein ASE38_03790 [Cellulomonas sp. Root930]
MQKAVTPAMSAAYLDGGYDRLAGFVVRAEDVAWATTPADLFEAHGLGFPGSPFTADAPHVDVLRFPATPQLRFENATGGPDQKTRELTGGPFVDRPPFQGTGFVLAPGHLVPLYWLVHSRVPAGSELVRVAADGTSTLLARYVDVGYAWVSDVVTVTPSPNPRISRLVGPMAKWENTYLSADVLGDDVVVVAEVEPPAAYGFERTPAGRFRRVVPKAETTELFEMDMSGRWNGLEVRVVDQWPTPDGAGVSRVSYTGHNADLAEGLQLPKVDAAVYEVTVPTDHLVEVVTTQLVPASWTTSG